MPRVPYTGRFAPSPTGDLHFGSLIAALGSYLQARSRGGAWLVRVEDIDPPREVAGSAQRIVSDLARLGLRPDGPILFQSSRRDAYRQAWQRLLREGRAFRCACSRKMLPPSGIYPGTCRARAIDGSRQKRIRFRAPPTPVRFEDRVMGGICANLAAEVGDFVVRRADGLPAYQLAVVVDDAFQAVTEVVRGADLLDSTARQIALQNALGLATPAYLHLPVAVLPDGSKLSKRLGSDPVHAQRPKTAIRHALEFLGHIPPANLELDRLLTWAVGHWDPGRVPVDKERPLPAGVLRT